MQPAQFRGVFSALATPFDADDRVDTTALRHLVAYQIDEGIAGLVPCGSTGEFASLSGDERRLVVETVIEEAGGRVPVLAQTGALTTAEAVSLSRHAAAAGAAAVLCVPPYYTAITGVELRDYYRAVVAAVAVPVVYYNIPWCSNVVLSAAEIVDLGRDVGIFSAKDSGGDLKLLTDLLNDHGDHFLTFTGWDHFTLYAFLLGARASIWGAATFMPAACVSLLQAVEQGRMDDAAALWRRLTPLLDFCGSHGYVAAVKAACDFLGVPIGAPRRPLAPLGPDETRHLSELLEVAGLYDASHHSRAES